MLINPTAGVDVRSKEFLLGKVERDRAPAARRCSIASDELDDLRVCDRVLVMFQGRLVAEMDRGWHDHELVAAMEGMDLQCLSLDHRAEHPGRPGRRPRGRAGRIAVARLRDLALIPAIIVIAIIGQIVNPVFLQRDNLINVLQTMSEIAVLVLAETMVLIVKKMDLSLESTMGLAPGVAAWLTVPKGAGRGLGLLPGGWAVPVALAVGLAIGAVNALLIIRFGLNGFIVTLGMLIVLRGLLTGISGGKTFFNLPGSMLYLGTAQWFGVPRLGLGHPGPVRHRDRGPRLDRLRPLAVRDRRQHGRGQGRRHPHRPGAVDR